MKLHLNNIAKIQDAEIIINGITVIAGKNNTGKSTLGKIVFCLFDALNNLEKKIRSQKLDYIQSRLISSHIRRSDFPHIFTGSVSKKASAISEQILSCYELKNSIEASEIFTIIRHDFLKETDTSKDIPAEVMDISQQIATYLCVPNTQVQQEIIEKTFNRVFYNQINSRLSSGTVGSVHAIVQGRDIALKFENDSCTEAKSDINLINKAICIDNPSIMNSLATRSRMGSESLAEQRLVELLQGAQEGKPEDDVVSNVLNKNKLKAVHDILNQAVAGSVSEPNGDFQYKEKDAQYAISFGNLSYGIKSFLILKMLLERSILQQRDVLILDEPEIHLHPEWQVLFAQAIVLLQKEFELSVIITTHSHFFVDAIHLYTQLYESTASTHYYIAENRPAGATVREVGGNLEELYASMSVAVDTLNELRAQIEGDE